MKPVRCSVMASLVLFLSAFACLAAAENQPTITRQAWAHKDKKIDLQLQGAGTKTQDLMSRILIQEAFSRYGIAYDEARIDVLESLFTQDAVLEIADGKGVPFEKSTGRSNIGKHFATALGQQGDQRRHLISNVVIERMDGGEATALAYGVVTAAADGLILSASVIYTANLQRDREGVWRFSYFFTGIDKYVGNKPSVKQSKN